MPIRCIAVQKLAVQFAKKLYLPLFSSETADKFSRDYAIEKSFCHTLHLVIAHLHRQNQVAHALHTRDFWLASLSIHFPIHSTRRAHEYPVTLSSLHTRFSNVGNHFVIPYSYWKYYVSVQWNMSNAVTWGPKIFGLIRQVAALQKTSPKRSFLV